MKKIISALSELIFSSKRSRFLWGVWLIAFLIRISIVVVAGDSTHPEMYEHGAIAHNLYTGHGFAMHWPYESLDPVRTELMKDPPQFEGAFMPPINPYEIYFLYLLFGETSKAILVIMIVSALFSSLLPIAVYRTARLFSDEIESRISSIIAALFLPAAYAVTTFSGSSLYQLVVVLTLGFAIRASQFPTYRSFIFLGVCTGIMTLLRSEFYILGFVLVASAGYFSLKNHHGSGRIQFMLSGFGILLLIVMPWTVRNYSLFGKFIPIVDHPWHEIWRGNNEFATGSGFNAEGNSIWENQKKYPAIITSLDAIPYDQQFDLRADSIFRQEVLGFVSQQPVRFAELAAIKLISLFSIDYYHSASRNPAYIIFMMLVIIPSFGGLFVLLQRSRRTSDHSIISFYLIFFVYYCAIVISTFILPRYQIYVFSALLPVTGLGFSKMKRNGDVDMNDRRKTSIDRSH